MSRPTKYDSKYCQEIIEYFDVKPHRLIEEKFHYKNGDEKVKETEVANDLPFLSKFARSIGVCHSTVINWTKTHPEFDTAYKQAKEMQEELLVTNGLKGLYNPSFTIFAAKNMIGWRDKHEHDLNGPLQIVIDVSDAGL